MPLNLFYTMVQKGQKWPKLKSRGGPALNSIQNFIFTVCKLSSEGYRLSLNKLMSWISIFPSTPADKQLHYHHTSIYNWHSGSDMQWYSNKDGDTSSASWCNRRWSAFMERTRTPSVQENRSQNWCASPVITSANPNSSPQFFISVIQLGFDYVASTFVPTMSAAQKNRLLGLWRTAIRCTAGATWQAQLALCLVELRLSNVEHLWALQLALTVQKCHLGTTPQDICKKLNRRKHSHETRGNQSCFTPFRPLTTSGSVCFSIVLLLSGTFFPNLFVRVHLIPPLNLTFSTLSSNHEVFLL